MNIDRARLFDKRVVQRNIRAGRVTKDEYRAWLGELSDTSEKIRPRDEGGDDDGYERPEPGSASSSAGASHSIGAPVSMSARVDDDDDDDLDDDDDDDDDDLDDEPPHGEAG